MRELNFESCNARWRLLVVYFCVWQRQKIHIKMIDGHELWLIAAKLAMRCWYLRINYHFKSTARKKNKHPKLTLQIKFEQVWTIDLSGNLQIIRLLPSRGKFDWDNLKKFSNIRTSLWRRFHAAIPFSKNKCIEKNGPMLINNHSNAVILVLVFLASHFFTLFFSLRDTSSITILIIIYQTKSFKMTK